MKYPVCVIIYEKVKQAGNITVLWKLYEASIDREICVLYFEDFDHSGDDMDDHLDNGLR
jgi:hypothetical protein